MNNKVMIILTYANYNIVKVILSIMFQNRRLSFQWLTTIIDHLIMKNKADHSSDKQTFLLLIT